VLCPAVRAKIERRLKEAIRLIVKMVGGRGVARWPKLVFQTEDVGVDKWIVPGAL
jgi:hypothetical protein